MYIHIEDDQVDDFVTMLLKQINDLRFEVSEKEVDLHFAQQRIAELERKLAAAKKRKA